MEQDEAPVREHPFDDGEEFGVILRADMLEHADRNHFVELTGQVAIVQLLDVDRPAGATRAGQFLLLFRHRDAEHFDAVIFSRITGQATPAAADVVMAFADHEGALARLQVEQGVAQQQAEQAQLHPAVDVPIGIDRQAASRPLAATARR